MSSACTVCEGSECWCRLSRHGCRSRRHHNMSEALSNSICLTQVRLWQALCVLCPFVPDDEEASALQTVWDMLLVGTLLC